MRKQYHIDQSPLYKLIGLNQLEQCLDIKLHRLPKLLKPKAYRTFIKDGRDIQHPVGWLNKVHERIAKLLARIEVPDYVYHKKGRSHILNAHEHKGHHGVIKTDISAYYPSVSRQHIKAMFINEFKCAKDVAGTLADICSYNGMHLPTGSPISGYIAFFANKELYDSVYLKAKNMG
ncbi:MAG: RNA-directed DNA polymerase, partial [Methylophilaceae bacterium]